MWMCAQHNFFVGTHLNFCSMSPLLPLQVSFPEARDVGAEKVTDPYNALAKDTGLTTDRL